MIYAMGLCYISRMGSLTPQQQQYFRTCDPAYWHIRFSKTFPAMDLEKQPLFECIACREFVQSSQTIKTSCRPESHTYCITCLSALVEQATKDETLFPPRCCKQAIPVDLFKRRLSPTLIQTYEEKLVEFNFPAEARTYCSRPECCRFIVPGHITFNLAWCPSCGRSTCTSCKQQGHPGRCSEDPDIAPTLTLARENGWRRCICGRMLERMDGCNHMT